MRGAIRVENVGKRLYRRSGDERPWTLQEMLVRGLRGLRAERPFWALRGVSFEIAPGRGVALIGHNGAGKSTLLRLIGRIGRPDEGTITTDGRIGGLLELGAGFHSDLTGRENIFINGTIAGLTRREVARRLDDIIAFAELEAVIDNPLRTYSTGMQMRLAFAVAAHTEPDILMIDEVLAVGDLGFQKKCLQRIAQFKKDGCTLLFVSHDNAVVRTFCDEAILLRDGELAAHGPTGPVLAQYVEEMAVGTRHESDRVGGDGVGGDRATAAAPGIAITAIRLRDAGGNLLLGEMRSGDGLQIEINWRTVLGEPAGCVLAVTITRSDETVCCDLTTGSAESALLSAPDGTGRAVLNIARLDLNDGLYSVDVRLADTGSGRVLDSCRLDRPLLVSAPPKLRRGLGASGVLCPPHYWEDFAFVSVGENDRHQENRSRL